MKFRVNSNFIATFFISLSYGGYRTFNVFNVEPFFDEFDSPAYFDFQIFPAFRTHGITSVFALLQNELAISLFQAIIGSLVWIYLWIVILGKLSFKVTKSLVTILFFVLASSSIIIEHDAAMLSESLSISSTVLLFATSIKITEFSHQIFTKNFYAWAFAFVWFSSTKSSNSIIIPLMTLPLIYTFITNYKFIRMKFIFGIILILSIFSFVNSISSDVSKTLNTVGTIHNRLWIDDKWREKLLLSGYPKYSNDIWLSHGTNDLGTPPDQAVVNLFGYKKWWENQGENFLIKFTVTNPDYAILGPVALPLLNSNFTYKQTLLSGWSQGTDMTFEVPGFRNSVLQRTIFWPDEPEKAYLVLSLCFISIGLSLLVLVKNKSESVFYLILISLFYVFLWSYFNWWFGSKPVDMNRHNLAAAVMFRLLAIFSIFYTIDLFIRQRLSILVRLNRAREFGPNLD